MGSLTDGAECLLLGRRGRNPSSHDDTHTHTACPLDFPMTVPMHFHICIQHSVPWPMPKVQNVLYNDPVSGSSNTNRFQLPHRRSQLSTLPFIQTQVSNLKSCAGKRFLTSGLSLCKRAPFLLLNRWNRDHRHLGAQAFEQCWSMATGSRVLVRVSLAIPSSI